MPVKVIGGFWDVRFGSARFEGGSDDDVARGIRYAADNGAKIINMSLGSSGPPDCATNSNKFGCSPVVEAAMRYAVGKGVFIVVAGGNEFEDNDPVFGRNPTSVLARSPRRSTACVRRGNRSGEEPRLLLEHRQLRRDLRAGRHVTRLRARWYRLSADVRFQLHTDLRPDGRAAVADLRAPRFDVLATIGITGHLDGRAARPPAVAAMLMQQGITNPAAIEAR